MTVLWMILLGSLTCLPLLGQERIHEAMVGTQFPVQIGLGYQYHTGKHLSGRVQAGLLVPPYDRFIIYSMEAFGFDKKYSKALDEAFQLGWVASLNPQYHFGPSGNHYLRLQGQFARLKGSIRLDEAVELLLDNQISIPDLSQLPIRIPDFSTRSNLFLLGVHYGHRFQLAHPRLTLQTEIGFNKIIGSRNEYTTNIKLLDNNSLVQVYYRNLDDRLRSYYLQYGYIPSISLYLIYRLGRLNE